MDAWARLRADCARCVGLCCVAPEFEESADFAFGKEAGRACRNLLADFRCGIHENLIGDGMRGCVAFDCQGAGQRVTQVTFGGRNWRAEPDAAWEMFNAFAIMRLLHEMLWYLTEAVTLPAAAPLYAELVEALERTEAATHGDASAFMLVDVRALRETVTPLLRRTSELVRAAAPAADDASADRREPRPTPADPARADLGGVNLGGVNLRRAELNGADRRGEDLARADLRGADLSGSNLISADLRGADLSGADLSGAKLADADLRGADLGYADLTRADLRGADVRGADLGLSFFITQYQVNTARGDATTRLPEAVLRPSHWTAKTIITPATR